MTDRKPRSEYTGSCAKLPYETKVPNMPRDQQEQLYIIFDGTPGHQAPGFVEVENAEGESRSVGHWESYGNYWKLGPIYAHAPDSSAKIAELEAEVSEWKHKATQIPEASGAYKFAVEQGAKLQAENAALKSDIAVRDQYVEELRQRERELLDKLNVAREALLNVEGMLDELRDYPVTHDLIIEALKKLGEK